MFKLCLEKAEETRDQIANYCWESKGILQSIYLCLILHAKAFNFVHHNKLENSFRDKNTRPSYLLPEKPVCGSRSNS